MVVTTGSAPVQREEFRVVPERGVQDGDTAGRPGRPAAADSDGGGDVGL